MNHPRPLARLVLLSLISVLGVLGSLVSLSLGVLRYQNEEKTIKRDLRIRSETLYSGLSAALWNYQSDMVFSMLEGLKKDPLLVFIQVRGDTGNIIYSWTRGTETRASSNLRDFTEIYKSLTENSQRKIGDLEIASSDSLVISRIWEEMIPSLASVAGLMGFSLIFLYGLLGRMLVKPLADFSRKISGDAQNLPSLSWNSTEAPVAEIAKLYESYDNLRSQLDDRQKEIEQANQQLEQRVELRTRELARAKKEAEDASRIKSQFLAKMSHEIRTPMNGILGFSQLLTSLDSEPAVLDYAHKIQVSAQNLLAVINDILDFSKIEAGELRLEKTIFSPKQIIGEAIDLFGLQARVKNLTLSLDWIGDTDMNVIGDPLRFSQILGNLISNGIKFTHTGGVVVRVKKPAGSTQPGFWEFSVEDTGIGILPEQRGKIFTAFSQGDDSITRKYGGTGLGLSISHELAGLMGGTLELDPTFTPGCRFLLRIPLDPAISQIPASPVIPKTLGNFNGIEILLVEDNKINQKLAKALLERLGASVTVADDGSQAVEAVKNRRFSAVLMDLQMPVMGGYEATEIIRKIPDHGELPIIALTAHALPGIREECLAAGMDDYMSKPFEISKLEQLLLKWTSS